MRKKKELYVVYGRSRTIAAIQFFIMKTYRNVVSRPMIVLQGDPKYGATVVYPKSE